MSTATATLWACTDCRDFAHGIDETERGEPFPAATLEAFADPARELGGIGRLTPGTLDHGPACIDPETGDLDPAENCDCEHIEFTWNRCDICLTAPGGARDAFTLWDN